MRAQDALPIEEKQEPVMSTSPAAEETISAEEAEENQDAAAESLDAAVEKATGQVGAGEAQAEPIEGERVGSETVESTQADSSATDALSWLNFFKPEGIPYAVIVLIVMGFLVRFLSQEANRMGERFADRRLVIQQTASFVRFLLYMMGLGFAVLTVFDLNEQLLLAIGGTIAVSAGFAMKDLVASLIAGVIILMDRPFQVGDRVTFAGYYGEVTHIGLRSVRLMTLDDTQVTVPNNLFLTEAVASGNAGAVDMMIQVDLFIGADQDLDEARRLLGEVVTTSRYVNLNRNWKVGIRQVIENDYFATKLTARAYVFDARLEKAFESDITERALDAFSVAHIEPPAVLHRNIGSEATPA